jgi:hypothetical protein
MRGVRYNKKAVQPAGRAANVRGNYVLFVDPTELIIADALTLNNKKAVILLFCECLNADNPLRRSVEGLHSRQTLLETVYDRVAPHTLTVLWSTLVGQLKGAKSPFNII